MPWVGGFHSRSAPARAAINESQPIMRGPAFHPHAGRLHLHGSEVPRRMNFSDRRGWLSH